MSLAHETSVWFTGTVRVSRALSGRRTLTYSMTITATDNGLLPLSSTALVVINVIESNSYTPQFTSNVVSVTISEDAAIGTLLLNVAARDLDQGVNGELRYAITDGDVNGHFGIDPVSGNLSVRSLLDYEQTQSYSLRVTVRDLAPISRQASRVYTITVTDVDDYVPYFLPQHVHVCIKENVAVGTEVFSAQVHGLAASSVSRVRYFIVADALVSSKFYTAI